MLFTQNYDTSLFDNKSIQPHQPHLLLKKIIIKKKIILIESKVIFLMEKFLKILFTDHTSSNSEYTGVSTFEMRNTFYMENIQFSALRKNKVDKISKR